MAPIQNIQNRINVVRVYYGFCKPSTGGKKQKTEKKTGKEEEKGTVKKTASTKEVKDRKNIYKKKIFLI